MSIVTEFGEGTRAQHGEALAWMGEMNAQLQKADAPSPVPVMRVNQIDAVQMDKDLVLILLSQLRNVFKHLQSDFVPRFKPEIEALLQAMIFRFSIWQDKPTPGGKLQDVVMMAEESSPRNPLAIATLLYGIARKEGIRPALSALASGEVGSTQRQFSVLKAINESEQYTGHVSGNVPVRALSTRQKVAYATLFIGVRWLWSRVYGYINEEGWDHSVGWRKRVHKVCALGDRLFRLGSLANMLCFLYYGKYVSMVGRMVGARLFYVDPRVARQIAFEFTNAQLLWHGIADFMLFLIPVVNPRHITDTLLRTFYNLNPFRGSAKGCTVCRVEPILLPYVTNCGHLFCYYCLAGSRKAIRGYRCPQCSSEITSQTPLHLTNRNGNAP